jgi:enolase-phosphatase E1
MDIAIFSSGSVLAQRLLFESTPAGDLAPYVRAYFDTTTGPKQDAQSYRRIARALTFESRQVLFLSDVVAELDAAREAGMRTALCVRRSEDAVATVSPPTHAVVYTFDDVCP